MLSIYCRTRDRSSLTLCFLLYIRTDFYRTMATDRQLHVRTVPPPLSVYGTKLLCPVVPYTTTIPYGRLYCICTCTTAIRSMPTTARGAEPSDPRVRYYYYYYYYSARAAGHGHGHGRPPRRSVESTPLSARTNSSIQLGNSLPPLHAASPALPSSQFPSLGGWVGGSPPPPLHTTSTTMAPAPAPPHC